MLIFYCFFFYGCISIKLHFVDEKQNYKIGEVSGHCCLMDTASISKTVKKKIGFVYFFYYECI